MASSHTVFHVTSQGREWYIKRGSKAIFTLLTKEIAVAEARIQAVQTRPSQVVVHGTDGKIEGSATYQAGPNPLPVNASGAGQRAA